MDGTITIYKVRTQNTSWAVREYRPRKGSSRQYHNTVFMNCYD